MLHDRQGRSPAGRHIEAVAGENLHILGNHLGVVHIRLNPRVAGDQPVNLVLGNARIFERQLGRFDIHLGRAQVGNDADLGIGRPHDRYFASKRFHTTASSFILPPV